jgi:TonB family protein
VGEGKALGPASAGAAVGSAAGGAPYSIEWLEGGSRRLVSGALPAYPAGVDVEAQIKLLTVVLPDGSVSSVQPMQKANRALEEAAAREVRQWKFEPLRSYQPQVPQSCVVTFQFRLR